MSRYFSRIAAACLLAMTLVLPAAAQQHVWVALGGEAGPYAEVAAVFRTEWPGGPLAIAPWADLAARTDTVPELVVTVGTAAFEGMLRNLQGRGPAWEAVPVLATLLPQSIYQEVLGRMRSTRRPVSAVVLDQPLSRQLALVRRALPARQRIAVLPGPQTRPHLTMLEREAQAQGMQLILAPPIAAPEDIFPALRQVLEQADVLLALPDSLVYNGATLQNILLTTYRARVPVATFSPAYVRAGALLAVYSTPAQVARHAIARFAGWRPGRPLPPPSAPDEFAVIANPKVAASLGIGLDDAAGIAEDLRRAGGGL